MEIFAARYSAAASRYLSASIDFKREPRISTAAEFPAVGSGSAAFLLSFSPFSFLAVGSKAGASPAGLLIRLDTAECSV